MKYIDFLYAGLAAGATAGLLTLGLVFSNEEKLSTADLDMVALAAIVTFVATVLARKPEWLSLSM